jgi:hypothetical protein
MTRKHYKIIAEALAESKPDSKVSLSVELDTWISVVLTVTAHLMAANSNFNRAKFLNACGYEKTTGIPLSRTETVIRQAEWDNQQDLSK